MTKVLWHTNAPWAPTGYGQQCGQFAPLLGEDFDLAVSSFYGLEGNRITWNGIPILPGMQGSFGNEYLPEHAREFFGGDSRGGIVLTLMDVWVMDPQMAKTVNMACWVPVDHEPAPPRVVEFFIESGAVPIAMSRFGESMLGRLDPLYVPHGIDTGAYLPHPKAKVREEVGFAQDGFLVGIVAANKGRPSRKSFQQALQAFAKFHANHENAYLYLHTTLNPSVAQGENLPGIIAALDLPSDHVLIADQYRSLLDPYSHNSMAKLYSTMDVLLNPAMGEGFGITVLEAQACGVPAIVTDFSAMREVCQVGWHVEYDRWWTGQDSWMAYPHIDDIVSALEECYGLDVAKREQMSDMARRHALRYDTRRVYQEFFRPAMRTVERRYSSQAPVRIPARVAA